MRTQGADAAWILEPVRTEDALPPILELDRAAFKMPWSREMFTSALASPGEFFLFALRAVDDPSLAGFICYRVAVGVLQIATIAIRHDLRRSGLGSKLVQFALAQGFAEGAREATLEVRVSNVPARRLYEHLGFMPVAVQYGYYHSPTEDALLYWRPCHDRGEIGYCEPSSLWPRSAS